MNLGGSGLNSANHAAHERLNAASGFKSTYVPYKGTGDMALAVVGSQIDGAVTYTPFAIGNKSKVRALAVAMDQRHPLMPDEPTFKELGDVGMTDLARVLMQGLDLACHAGLDSASMLARSHR